MRKIIAVWLVMIMLMGGMLGIMNLSTDAENGNGDADLGAASQSKSGLTAHDPIYITSDSDFASQASSEGWAGNGTEGNPYIIENYDIEPSVDDGIEIRNTNVCSIIRNCIIHDAGGDHGIYFYNVTNGKIENCEIYNNYQGIKLYSSNNNTISNCVLCDNSYGIEVDDSPNNNIIDNTFTNGGIAIIGDLDDLAQTIKNNTVNGKPLYYFLNEDGITLDNIEVGQLFLVNCTNFIIKNLDISYTDGGMGLVYSSNNKITNCAVYNNNTDIGIWLDSSSNNQITNCNVYNNYYGIILLRGSSNNYITNCGVHNNSWSGIHVELYSNNNNISNCDVYNNNYGIWLTALSNNNQITNCGVYNNDDGIRLVSSSDNQITYCDVYSNSDIGISLSSSSSNNKIHYNNIYNNANYGVKNYDSETKYQAIATHNWWGDASGPSGVGTGSGDAVNSNVLYEPWLTEPVEGAGWTAPEGEEAKPSEIPWLYIIIPVIIIILAAAVAGIGIKRRKRKVAPPPPQQLP